MFGELVLTLKMSQKIVTSRVFDVARKIFAVKEEM
jgi:hypothetical protein